MFANVLFHTYKLGLTKVHGSQNRLLISANALQNNMQLSVFSDLNENYHEKIWKVQAVMLL